MSASVGHRKHSRLTAVCLSVFLGGVFTDRDEGTETHSMESVFKYAIFHYNRLSNDSHSLSFKIRIKEETLSLISSESAVQTVHDGRLVPLLTALSSTVGDLVCSLVHQRGVQGIFGPPYPELSTLVHSICYHVDIPFINVCSTCYDVENPDDEINDDTDQLARRDRMSINLYPSNQELNFAFHNLTHKLQWTKFLIVYDMDSGLTRLQKLLNDPGINQTDILVRQFTHYKDRSVLVDAIGRDINNIILDLNDENTRMVLKMALQMGMINSNYHFLLTTLVGRTRASGVRGDRVRFAEHRHLRSGRLQVQFRQSDRLSAVQSTRCSRSECDGILLRLQGPAEK